MSEAITQVSDTAFMAAAYRAREMEHSEPLFRDPLAATLAGERGMNIIERLPKRAFVGGWTVVMRTRIIDDLIVQAIGDGVDTVLNLGAGLDTRPYRLALPASLRWIEVDYPHVIALKEDRLAGETPACQLERVALDLAEGNARRKLFAEVAATSGKVLVLTEAVTPYLAEADVASLARDLAAHDCLAYWLVDYFSPASYAYRRRSGMSKAMQQAPFLFEPEDYFDFFLRTGWAAKETRYFAVEAERWRRPAPFPVVTRIVTRILGLLASAERRQAMKQFAGFTLFVPAR